MLEKINELRTVIGFEVKQLESEKGIRGKEKFFWGFPDGLDTINKDWTIYYEIEYKQSHPSTNVIKYWPILEEFPERKIVLIQWLVTPCSSRNRWELCKFFGAKMESEFPDRFQYLAIELGLDINVDRCNEIKKRILETRALKSK